METGELAECTFRDLVPACEHLIGKKKDGTSPRGYIGSMDDVTQILFKIESGDQNASEELLPLVYAELRSLAASRMSRERTDQTLQPTALVHEAYIRLVGAHTTQHWDSRGHFFAAAAEAMRRILVDAARQRNALKRGGDRQRIELPELAEIAQTNHLDLLALDEALCQLEQEQPKKAQLVKLRFFAGRSLEETAKYLGVSRATAQRDWALARAWLYGRLHPE